jgi:hypothetical protein
MPGGEEIKIIAVTASVIEATSPTSLSASARNTRYRQEVLANGADVKGRASIGGAETRICSPQRIKRTLSAKRTRSRRDVVAEHCAHCRASAASARRSW